MEVSTEIKLPNGEVIKAGIVALGLRAGTTRVYLKKGKKFELISEKPLTLGNMDECATHEFQYDGHSYKVVIGMKITPFGGRPRINLLTIDGKTVVEKGKVKKS